MVAPSRAADAASAVSSQVTAGRYWADDCVSLGFFEVRQIRRAQQKAQGPLSFRTVFSRCPSGPVQVGTELASWFSDGG